MYKLMVYTGDGNTSKSLKRNINYSLLYAIASQFPPGWIWTIELDN
jgi:hypothetical protein